MAIRTKLTYEDFESFPDDENRYELIDGEVCVSPPPLTVHQWASEELSRRIGNHVIRKRSGRVFYAPFAVALSPFDVFEPDIVFISTARLSLLVERGIQGPPDLCIEILSPSTSARDRTVKFERYAQFGVPEYWIVDPEARTVEVFCLEHGTFVSSGIVRGKAYIASQVLPELRLRVQMLFPSA